jgi:hypothetical protein
MAYKKTKGYSVRAKLANDTIFLTIRVIDTSRFQFPVRDYPTNGYDRQQYLLFQVIKIPHEIEALSFYSRVADHAMKKIEECLIA